MDAQRTAKSLKQYSFGRVTVLHVVEKRPGTYDKTPVEYSEELAEKSLQNQRYRLKRFIEFCEDTGLKDLSDLTGRHLHQYRVYRTEMVKPVTLSGELQTLRMFLEFCASIDAVQDGMRERVQIPKIDPDEETKDELLENDRAE